MLFQFIMFSLIRKRRTTCLSIRIINSIKKTNLREIECLEMILATLLLEQIITNNQRKKVNLILRNYKKMLI